MSWTLAEIATRCGGRVEGDGGVQVSGVSTDSRTLERGEIFVAIAGENFDGHDHVADAAERGATAALLSRDVDCSLPCARVDDTIAALGRFAAREREAFAGPVIAITGSNGKTTTKELCADMLEAGGATVRRSPGNLNNHIGLPLSILGLRAGDEVLVVELGMNQPGEIDALARIAQPDVGAITQVAPAHLGPMGSLEAIAQAKGELLDHVREGGTAVLNADDALVMAQRERFKGNALLFGLGEEAEVRATGIDTAASGTRFRLETPQAESDVSLALPGCHLVQDALCAAAATIACGALGVSPVEPIREALEAFRGVRGRTFLAELRGGVRLLDDSYNANPHSVAAALRALAQLRGGARSIAVLGDMGELGDEAAALHAEVGRKAAGSGVDALLGVGPLSIHTVEAAHGAGLAQVEHADDAPAAIEILRGWLREGDVVLLKGSRSMRMERISAALGDGD
jgi:UDP-N-acetylmuramoyl-tripeptide--D-alanyl-D-alanine ligase